MVRILIERWLAPGAEERLHAAMRDLRRSAIHVAGYISGETLRDAEDPRHVVVISTWSSRPGWDAWAVSQARQEARTRIAPLLAAPEKVTVLEPA